MVNFGDFLKTSKCDFFVIFNHCVEVVRFLQLSEHLIRDLNFKGAHQKGLFVDFSKRLVSCHKSDRAPHSQSRTQEFRQFALIAAKNLKDNIVKK